MKHQVIYTLNAQREIEETFLWIQERLPRAAELWRDELIAKVESLADEPTSHRLAPESAKFPKPIHKVLFRKRRSQYRILYIVDSLRVVILSVRHCFRRPLEEGDLPL